MSRVCGGCDVARELLFVGCPETGGKGIEWTAVDILSSTLIFI